MAHHTPGHFVAQIPLSGNLSVIKRRGKAMSQALQKVELECTKGSSNKFYHVEIVLDAGDMVTFRSWYGPIGKNGQPGVSGSFVCDAREAIKSRTIDNHIAKLCAEANKLIQGKAKKGYNSVGPLSSINPATLITQLHSRFPDAVNATTQQPKAPVAGAFEVEIIGISMGVIRVAKVLEDFNYDVLGDAKNPKQRSVKTGDVVSVISRNNQMELV
jgi:predicted DNA-binding WGR domain protein